jgi:hypothetical protein
MTSYIILRLFRKSIDLNMYITLSGLHMESTRSPSGVCQETNRTCGECEIADILPPSDDNIIAKVEDTGWLATEYPRQAEREGATVRRDQIVEDMWIDYQRVLQEHTV